MQKNIYIYILKVILIHTIEYTDRVDINDKSKTLFTIKGITNEKVLVFHPEYSIIRKIGDYSNVINKISNNAFLFSGTFYPLDYTENNFLYYIVSPTSLTSPSKFQIYYNTNFSNNDCLYVDSTNNCILNNPFEGFSFS